MLNKLHFTGALFALVVMHDIGTKIQARKAATMYLAGHQAHEYTHAAHLAQIKYLCTIIDNNDYTFDEFDLIMLNDPIV